MPPDLIVRPAGIWDSRAPFNEYLREHVHLNRAFNILALAEAGAQEAIEAATESRNSLRGVFNAKGSAEAALAWRRYVRSYGSKETNEAGKPMKSELQTDIRRALYDVRAWTIVSVAGAFEQFVEAWTLNYLLAVLEEPNPRKWTTAEREVAVAMSPVHGGRTPGWPWILRRIPECHEGLRGIPHVFTDRSSGAAISEPTHAELNCWSVLEFWRDYRNVTVHRGRFISSAFAKKHQEFFEHLRAPYNEPMEPLAAGRLLQVWDSLVVAVMTAHYRAATWMREYLVRASAERRGHIAAPGPVRERSAFVNPPQSPPLLMDGDHELSLRWRQDWRRVATELDQLQSSRGTWSDTCRGAR